MFLNSQLILDNISHVLTFDNELYNDSFSENKVTYDAHKIEQLLINQFMD